MRLAGRRRLLFGLVVAVLGVAALAVSFVLTPTPNTFAVLSNGRRVRVPADMHAVDYATLFLRIGGALVLLAGAYLASRARQPPRSPDAEDAPDYEPSDPAGWAADITRSATRRF
jgi:threonine/homoserine/homoserine lactone efflux protein